MSNKGWLESIHVWHSGQPKLIFKNVLVGVWGTQNINLPGADPEILQGRWLMGWLSVKGWLINNGGPLL